MNENLKELLTILPTDSVAMSPQIDQFCEAFLKVQSKIEPIKKSMNGHRHKYANIDAVLDEILPILEENKIFVNQPPVTNGADKLQTILFHKSGQFISYGGIKIIHDPQDPQSFGSGVTYTRRYSLVSILGLPQEDDDGNYQKRQYEQKQQNGSGVKKMITQEQIDDIKGKIIDKCDNSEERNNLYKQILSKTEKKDLSQLTEKQYYFILKEFNLGR